MSGLIPDIAWHLEMTGPEPKLLAPRLTFLLLIIAIGNRHPASNHACIDIAGLVAASDKQPVVAIALVSAALRGLVRNQLLQCMLRLPATGPVLPLPLASLRQFRRVDTIKPHAFAIENEAVAVGGAKGALVPDVGPIVELGRD